MIEEFGSFCGIKFITSSGIKRMDPGKKYDRNLDEIGQLEGEMMGLFKKKTDKLPEKNTCIHEMSTEELINILDNSGVEMSVGGGNQIVLEILKRIVKILDDK